MGGPAKEKKHIDREGSAKKNNHLKRIDMIKPVDLDSADFDSGANRHNTNLWEEKKGS